MKKMDRDEFVTYLDITPTATEMDFNVLGVGITDYGIAYNPQVEQEKWIIEKNARTIHQSNQKQGSVSQSIYKDDPCYQFVRKGLDKLNYRTHILDVNMAEEISDGVYEAKLSDGIIAITQYMNDNATIEYDLYYDGDPKEGTVTIGSDGKPVFTPVTSL